MAAGGLTPLAELIGEGLLVAPGGAGLEVEKALVHQIEGVIDQLGGLFGGHGGAATKQRLELHRL
jgi:hypothetical protein